MMDDTTLALGIVVALLLTVTLEALRSLRGRPLGRASALLTAVLLAFALDVAFALLQRAFATAELPRYLAFAFLQGTIGWFLYRGLEREERDAARSASVHRQPTPLQRRLHGGPPMVSQARKALAEHPEWRLRGDVWDTFPAPDAHDEDAGWMNDQPELAQTRPNLSAVRATGKTASTVRRAAAEESPQAWGDLPTLPYVESHVRRMLAEDQRRPAS